MHLEIALKSINLTTAFVPFLIVFSASFLHFKTVSVISGNCAKKVFFAGLFVLFRGTYFSKIERNLFVTLLPRFVISDPGMCHVETRERSAETRGVNRPFAFFSVFFFKVLVQFLHDRDKPTVLWSSASHSGTIEFPYVA